MGERAFGSAVKAHGGTAAQLPRHTKSGWSTVKMQRSDNRTKCVQPGFSQPSGHVSSCMLSAATLSRPTPPGAGRRGGGRRTMAGREG
eukprot:2379154-Prymnesium_polylepis.1